jgi:hypothetical protein
MTLILCYQLPESLSLACLSPALWLSLSLHLCLSVCLSVAVAHTRPHRHILSPLLQLSSLARTTRSRSPAQRCHCDAFSLALQSLASPLATFLIGAVSRIRSEPV